MPLAGSGVGIRSAVCSTVGERLGVGAQTLPGWVAATRRPVLQVIQRRAQQTLAQKKARLHIVEGFLVAVDDLDAVVRAIRSTADARAARGALQEGWGFTEVQADAVLNISLRRLTGLAVNELKGEKDDLVDSIAQLDALLGDPVCAHLHSVFVPAIL